MNFFFLPSWFDKVETGKHGFFVVCFSIGFIIDLQWLSCFCLFLRLSSGFKNYLLRPSIRKLQNLLQNLHKEFFELLTLLLNFRYTFVSRFSLLYMPVLLAPVKCFLLVVWCLFIVAIYMGVQYAFFSSSSWFLLSIFFRVYLCKLGRHHHCYSTLVLC